MSIASASAFRSEIAGTVIEPGDPSYDAARAVHNGMIDRRPAVIVQCATADDVSTAVRLAHDMGLAVAIRGGGHSGPGFGTCDGGIGIDLSGLRRIDGEPAPPSGAGH